MICMYAAFIFAAGSFPCLLGTIHFHRKFSVYFITTYFPSLLVVIMSWVTFWLDVTVVTPRISIGKLGAAEYTFNS